MYKLKITICLIIIFCSCTSKKNKKIEEEKQPNLIIIQTDEHNFRTLGAYRKLLSEAQAFPWGKGIEVETPNLDRLAKEGAICTNYYASSPVCTPSRASFQTGLYPVATGCPINAMGMFKELTTFAEVLKQSGYSTSYVGKWHLAGKLPKGISKKDHIKASGYDDDSWLMRSKNGHAKWVKPDYELKQMELSYNEPKIKHDSLYITDFLTDRALEILERDKENPFCLMLSLPNPHSPDVAREPYSSMYANLEVQMPNSMKAELVKKRPLWAVGGKSESNEFSETSVREYFGMVKCIDDNFGRILKFLDTNSLSENTIVVFTSDHGDLLYEHHRENKDQPYEASAKIPFLIRYPKKIKAGKVITNCFTTCDFPPTILGMMNQKQIPKVHGINATETFFNNKIKTSSDRTVYVTDSPFSEWTAATNGKHKLVLSCKDIPWLFDLTKDPEELINFYSDPEYKEIAMNMQKELINSMELYKDPSLALGLKYSYSADDEITYKGPYHGKTSKQIKKIEKEVLNHYIKQIEDKCYKDNAKTN